MDFCPSAKNALVFNYHLYVSVIATISLVHRFFFLVFLPPALPLGILRHYGDVGRACPWPLQDPVCATLPRPVPHSQCPGNTLSDLFSSGWDEAPVKLHSDFCPLLQSLHNHSLPLSLHLYKVIITLTLAVGCFEQQITENPSQIVFNIKNVY